MKLTKIITTKVEMHEILFVMHVFVVRRLLFVCLSSLLFGEKFPEQFISTNSNFIFQLSSIVQVTIVLIRYVLLPVYFSMKSHRFYVKLMIHYRNYRQCQRWAQVIVNNNNNEITIRWVVHRQQLLKLLQH